MLGFDPGAREQLGELKLPDESVKKDTVPIGLDGAVVLVSVTVAVQVVGWPTATGEPHDKLVLVKSMKTFCIAIAPWPFSGRTPFLSSTNTQMSVVPILLGRQAFSLGWGGEGKPRGVFGVLPTTR